MRSCLIHGLGNKGNLNLLYQIVAKRIPLPLGAFENQRSFCSIDNVCFVINEILENESIPSGIYNLADDEAISTNKLITLIADSQNKKAHILKIPKGVISGIAKIGDVLKLPLNSERLQKLTESYVVSNEKMVKAIGKPLPYSAEEGLVKDHEKYLAVSDVLCLPSSSEGFGSIVIEAAALEVPSIGFDIVGLSDSIEHDFSGILVPFKDVDKFSEAMIDLYQDKKRLEKLKFNARERVLKYFSADAVYAFQSQFYKSLF